jgi:hypothetical protein
MATITLPYDPTWKALEWAKKNCSSYVTNHAHESTVIDEVCPAIMYIDYVFTDNSEALLFALKWA